MGCRCRENCLRAPSTRSLDAWKGAICHGLHEKCQRLHCLGGGSDRRLALFENLFPIPRGVSYNSYVILDEKTALLDTVDSSIALQFLQNVRATLGDRPLDYLIVNHMEPDHCATIEMLLPYYPT